MQTSWYSTENFCTIPEKHGFSKKQNGFEEQILSGK